MGKEQYGEMKFWTKDEYMKFSEAVIDKEVSYNAIEILYWCGICLGELLALTPADFNFKTDTLSITKSYGYKIVRELNKELAQKGYMVVEGQTNR